MGWLSLSIWTPIVFGVILLFFNRDDQVRFGRWFALIGSIISFAVTIPLYVGFNPSSPNMQFVENIPWIPRFNINYHLGVDGISVWFVLLTAFMTFIVIAAGWEIIQKRVNQYNAAFLILSGMMIGVFTALDGILFYMAFESTLVPMYLIIGVWGGKNRIYAAIKFFLYTFLGSLMMLVSFIYLYARSGGSFNVLDWQQLPLSATAQTWLFFGLFAAFAVKVPMWPIHTWLPDAHVEAPTGGSVILAAIMLKLGCYGFLRFSLPILPDASHEWAWLMIFLSLMAIIYIGLVALVQPDMKKLVAYSSIAHMGYTTAGLFSFNAMSIEGGVVQMLSHGFVSGAMFQCIGVLYDRLHTHEIKAFGGVINSMPRFGAFALLFFMANCGLPGTSGFVGEWMVILGTVKVNFWIGLLIATGLISGAGYTLWMFKRVYYGAVANGNVRAMKEINARECFIMALMAITVLWLGLYPAFFTNLMDTSVAHLVQQVALSKLN
jgi:NADH-quinone oxidoreductase subunit M